MKQHLLLLVLVASMMTGCLTTSINSIFTPKDILPGDEITGKWEVDGDSVFENYLLISKSDDKRLNLTYIRQHTENSKLISIDTIEYIGNMGKIHGVLFLEFKPNPREIFYPGMMIPTYYFARVFVKNNKMNWYAISAKMLNRYLQSKEFSIKASFLEDTESLVITDNTKNIQKFLKRALKKKEIFENSNEYVKVE